MAKQKAPSFQFYYRDWLHAVTYWTAEQKVLYLEMLCLQADSPNGRISAELFNSICEDHYVRGKFAIDDDGFFNERMENILIKRDNFNQSQKDKINKRWNKTGNTGVDTGVLPLRKLKTENRNKNTENRKTKTKGGDNERPPASARTKETSPLVYPFTNEEFLHAWEIWRDYKKEQFNFTYKPIGEQAALKSLSVLAGGESTKAVAIIHQSLENGWKGLFDLKVPQGKDMTQQQKSEAVKVMADYFVKKYKNKNSKL